MQLLGFIREYEQNNSLKKFKEYKLFEKNSRKAQVLKYLRNGIPIATKMHIIESLKNDDDTILGGIIYFSDGFWIWTNYYIYYLDRYDMEIDIDFINHLHNNKFEIKDTNSIVSFLKEHNIL